MHRLVPKTQLRIGIIPLFLLMPKHKSIELKLVMCTENGLCHLIHAYDSFELHPQYLSVMGICVLLHLRSMTIDHRWTEHSQNASTSDGKAAGPRGAR